MRFFVNTIAACALPLLLISCSGSNTLKPIDPPADMDEVLAEFLSICSRSMNALEAGKEKAESLGWATMQDAERLPFVLQEEYQYTKEMGTQEFELRIGDFKHPHTTYRSCGIHSMSTDGDAAQIDFKQLNSVGSFKGDVYKIEGGFQGRWSAKHGSDIVTMHAMSSEYFLRLNMGRDLDIKNAGAK